MCSYTALIPALSLASMASLDDFFAKKDRKKKGKGKKFVTSEAIAKTIEVRTTAEAFYSAGTRVCDVMCFFWPLLRLTRVSPWQSKRRLQLTFQQHQHR